MSDMENHFLRREITSKAIDGIIVMISSNAKGVRLTDLFNQLKRKFSNSILQSVVVVMNHF